MWYWQGSNIVSIKRFLFGLRLVKTRHVLDNVEGSRLLNLTETRLFIVSGFLSQLSSIVMPQQLSNSEQESEVRVIPSESLEALLTSFNVLIIRTCCRVLEHFRVSRRFLEHTLAKIRVSTICGLFIQHWNRTPACLKIWMQRLQEAAKSSCVQLLTIYNAFNIYNFCFLWWHKKFLTLLKRYDMYNKI